MTASNAAPPRPPGGPAIRFQRPQLPPSPAVEDYFERSRADRWFSNRGPCHRLLTDRLSALLGEETEVVLVANATLGLMLALRCLVGEEPTGSLVIVPSFTFPATAQAIWWNGLRPLWVDVEPSGWHLDPEGLRDALAQHGTDVAAVLACSTFGTAPSAAQAASWRTLCASAGVPLLIDSAAGFGSLDDTGARLGGRGDTEVFSFHATKPFGIGEGGAVATRDGALARMLERHSNFGFDFDHVVASPFGLNAKLSESHAATGLAVLDEFEHVLRTRRSLARSMVVPLESAGYRFQAGADSSAWQFVPTLAPSAAARDAALAAAADAGIELRAYHEPLHAMPAFAEGRVASTTLSTTETLARRTLSLPLANDFSHTDARRVVDLLLRCAPSPGEQVTA